jgi:hypothetical protein
VTVAGTDWSRWHEAYDRDGSGLADRLAAVRRAIARHLDATAPNPVRVVSACAGDGRDLLGVLTQRADADRVSTLLVELDPDLADRAEEAAAAVAARVEVRRGDAALADHYRDAVPADLVLLCGVLGNVSDDDVRATVTAAPQLCAPGATVVWTRHRHPPDLTPSIRGWFADAGFDEVSFDAPADDLWSVGVHRLVGPPQPLQTGARWFRFLR